MKVSVALHMLGMCKEWTEAGEGIISLLSKMLVPADMCGIKKCFKWWFWKHDWWLAICSLGKIQASECLK